MPEAARTKVCLTGWSLLLAGFLCASTAISSASAADVVKEDTYVVGKNYLGCYEDSEMSPDMGSDRTTLYELTVEKCTAWCKERGTKYMGLQDGDICSCGDSFGRYGMGADFDCSAPCEGNNKQRCGGVKHNSIYSV